ncbi:MAG: WYL domain-containing protein [Acidobacteriota bacterium]
MLNTNSPSARLARLLQLIQELQLRPNQSPQQLCKRFGIKRSTFHSDKKVLAEAGFIWHYDRRRGGYLHEGDSILPLLDLNLREALAMVLAIRQFSASGDATLAYDAVEGVKKLITATPAATRRLLAGLLEGIMRTTFRSEPAIINTIAEAQRSRHHLIIQYQDRSRNRLMRYEIAPYQIFFQARALYLDCYITSESRIATLRISRIKKVESYGGLFNISPDYDFVARHRHTFRAISSQAPPQKIRLRFFPAVAELIWESHWHASEHKLTCSDGSLILELTVSEPKEVLWYLVMPYAEHVDILEPDTLRQELLRIIYCVQKQHQNPTH